MTRQAISRRFCILVSAILVVDAACAFGQARPAAAPPASVLVDLNAASRGDLMTLDGIGEVRADAIIRARPFKAKTELVERRLIPESLYEKIADRVVARPVPGTKPKPATRPPAQKRS